MSINAALVLVIIGGISGLFLGIANKYLVVKEDRRVADVIEMLPGANCGGCGYPGCSGFANALVDGETTYVSKCVVGNEQTRKSICKYLNETPGPNGEILKVTIK